MNRLKLAVVGEALGLPIRGVLNEAAKLGASGVQLDAVGDLAPDQLGATGRREFKNLLRGNGLALTALNCPLRRGLDNPEHLQARLDHLAKVMQLAADLGPSLIIVPLPPLPPPPAEGDKPEPRAQTLRDALTALAQTGDRTGCRVAVEPGLDAAPATEAYLSTFDTGSLGVNLDPANFLAHRHDALAAVTAFGRRIWHTQARDVRRAATSGLAQEVAVGAGDVDWPLYLATLESIEYAGFLTVDRESGTSRRADVAAGVAYLSRFLGPLRSQLP